tara:strand:- start:149 stop:661 length:513 start_codon:yes stop_codon:yes gene_type:complete
LHIKSFSLFIYLSQVSLINDSWATELPYKSSINLFKIMNIQEFNNLNPLQLELPFTKCSHRHNAAYYENCFPILSNDNEFLIYFNSIIPSANWDKRDLKKFIAEIMVTDCEVQTVECYAVSERVARIYLQDHFVLNDLHCLPDLPTNFLNEKIRESYDLEKSFEGQMNAQ